jgi:transposase InsO family protein
MFVSVMLGMPDGLAPQCTSRGGFHSPQTNGVIERFFGTLKYEHLYRARIEYPLTGG